MEDNFLKVAKQAALEAGRVIKKHSGKDHKLNIKNNDVSNFATIADLEAEDVVIKIISQNFPNHNIIAEESGRVNNSSNYMWVIDPLDGTIAFNAKIPYFTVSIGLLKDNQPLIGVLNQVEAGELYWASKGRGAYVNGRRIKVSKVSELERAMFGVDFGHRVSRQNKLDVFIKPLMYKVSYLFSLGSDAAILGLLSKGNLDVFATEGWVWDFAAGAIIVKEAGGEITDLEGKELDWTKERLNIVASNGLIHDQILEALKGK